MQKAKWIMVGVVAGLAGLSQAALTHRYLFENGLADSVGGLNAVATKDGNYIEAPTYVSAAPAGSVGSAVSVSLGNNIGTKKSVVTVPVKALGDTGTLVLWFKPDSSANLRYLLTSGLMKGFAAVQITDSKMNMSVVKADNQNGSPLSYAGSLTDWHFYAVSWDKTSGKATAFLDDASVEFSFTPANWIPGNVLLGGFSPADNETQMVNQYDGLIYDVQIYDAVLATEKIGTLKNKPGSVIAE